MIPFACQMKGQSLRAAVEDYHRRANGKAVIDYAFHLILSDPTDHVLSSDHAPFRYADLKGKQIRGKNVSFAWVPNGIPGLQTRMALLFSEGVGKGRVDLSTGPEPARRREPRCPGSLVQCAVSFFEQRFELRKRIEVLRAPCSTFCTDEARQIQTPAPTAEDLHHHRMRNQRVVVSASDDFPQQVDVADGGREREVEPALDRRRVPVEWQPGRSAPQVGSVRS